MLYDVTAIMLEKNKLRHPKWTAKDVRVIPSTIKSFVTNDMKVLIRSWYDRGLISYKSALTTTTELDFEVEVRRRLKEDEIGLSNLMYPRLIMNQEAVTDNAENPETIKEVAPEKVKSEKDVSKGSL
jgi:NRPS condensation-like uncharacterized protein